ncbi:hypothetical protein ACFL6I_24835, partial [candidate division KSB1 bacterium]
LLIICFLLGGIVYGQDDLYFETMKNTLSEMDKAEGMENMQLVANKFERIASAEKDKWLPHYYASYIYILMSYYEEDNKTKDLYLDKAENHLEMALNHNEEESEIYALKGMLEQSRIQVDPATRGMIYSQKASKALEKAEKLNPDNPRIFNIKAMGVMYTPEMFGGGMEKACPIFEIANQKFEIYKPSSEIAPNWGKEINNENYLKCSNPEQKK